MNEQVLANASAINLLSGRVKKLENSAGGGGGGKTYKISLTLNGTTVSNVDYNGSTATEIAMAVADDPTTSVVYVIDAGSDQGVLICRPSVIQASYDTTWGDIATSITAIIPVWYEFEGDRKAYMLRLRYSSQTWDAQKQASI